MATTTCWTAQANVRLLHARLSGGARLRERVFHSQAITEIYDQIDECFASMIECGVPPDALTREEREFIDPKPRDPKTAEFTRNADSYWRAPLNRRGERRLF